MSSTFIEWVGDGAFVLGFLTWYGKFTLSEREKIWILRSKPLASICNMWRMIFLSMKMSSLTQIICHAFLQKTFFYMSALKAWTCVQFCSAVTRDDNAFSCFNPNRKKGMLQVELIIYIEQEYLHQHWYFCCKSFRYSQ